MSASAAVDTTPSTGTPNGLQRGMNVRRRKRRRATRTVVYHTGSTIIALAWFAPIAIVIVTSFRSFDDVTLHGIASIPHSFTVGTYTQAWTLGGLGRALANSMIVTIPTVVLSLLLSAVAAFGLSRFRIPLRRTILLLMLAGNLMPPQMLLIPVAQFAQQLGVFDTLGALIAIQVAFGLGFYTFVLYGFMRSIPGELQDAAAVDGAGTTRLFWQIILPLTRPALAALGALSFTWIFNDLLWSITLLQTTAKFPITPAVLSLQGEYVSSWSTIAAGTVIAAIPPTIVFLVFQRSFIGGLTLGSVK